VSGAHISALTIQKEEQIMKTSRRSVLVAGTASAVVMMAGANPSSSSHSQGNKTSKKFDVVIVGGGSAGAVLASRLSEDQTRRVLLIEAGPNFAPGNYPPVLKNANIVAGSPAFDWNYSTQDAALLGHNVPVPRGRVIGGSSAVNGTVAMRARATDFARWAERGIEGWSWKEVLGSYKAMENTPSGDDTWHGRSGPFPIRQRTAQENTVSMRAFVDASEATGLSRIADFNGANQHGVGPYPLNVVDGVRMNTGMVYLTPSVRARSNLTIRADAEVDAVVFQGHRASGVRLADGKVILAGEVVLAAGAFGSPAILMRSGIGPSSHLSELGIQPLVDLPVGDRLQDHPFYYNVYALKREVNQMDPAAGAIVWTRSSSAKPDELDLHISGTHFIDPKASPTGGAIVLAAAVTLPKSIGKFRLASRDPRVAPRIHYNFFADKNDLDRMVEAVMLSRQIGKAAPFSDLVDHEMSPGSTVDDEKSLRSNIVSTVAAYLHPTSTVPMGTASDPTAVVDAWGKVKGVSGLRVVDASILPDIPSVATNVTTIMVAERIAAKIFS
jgi:choline dehydrogenase